MINEKSRKNVWWKCRECGNEWKSVVYAWIKGTVCPVCADRAVLAGYNDLETTDAHLLAEWDYEKNKYIEYRRVIQSLISLKNSLIEQGRYTDAVDDILIKFSKAHKKRVTVHYI